MECSRFAFLARSVLRTGALGKRWCHAEQLPAALRDKHYPKLGNRDIVCYGWNGHAIYMDREDFPAPPVRFMENTKEIMALRGKEKGDWKNLTLDEKKTLYRASFRMTFAEMTAPTGEWKAIVAIILLGMSLTGWICIYLKKCVLPEMPHTITKEWQEKQVELMVKQRQGAVTGISSHWDYENNRWK